MLRAAVLASVAVVLGCATVGAPRSLRVVAPGSLAHGLALAATEHPLDPRVTLSVAEVDAAAPVTDDDSAARIARARTAYLETLDFDACRAELSAPSLADEALARGDRTTAARVWFWLAACDLAIGDTVSASEIAERMAAAQLPIPEGAELASPRVEVLVVTANGALDTLPRGELSVTTVPEGASVLVDGESVACTTPCERAVRPGAHVVTLSLPGYVDASERIVVASDAPQRVDATLVQAAPDVALAQWSLRYVAEGDETDIETWPAMRLLSLGLRARELVLVSATVDGEALLLRGTLSVDESPPLRAERRASAADGPEGVRALLRDLLRDAGITPPTPIYEEPLFWVAVIGAAAVAGVVTFALVYEPDVRTTLVLERPE